MASTLITIDMATRVALKLWKNSNAFMRNIDTQYDNYFAITGAKIGSTLRIRLPVDYTVGTGSAISFQDTVENSLTLTLATQNNVALSFTQAERSLQIDEYGTRYIVPAVNNLTGEVASGIMSGSEGGVCNYVDLTAAGVIITPSTTTILNANAILHTQSAPAMDHRLVVNPFTDARVAGSLAGLFNPSTAIGEQYRSGSMKNALGFDWMMDQTVIAHTSGTFTAGTVNGAGQTGTTLTTNAITGTLKRGDIITIANVLGVNRITKDSYGSVRQFVVLADVASSGTSISIYPAIIPTAAGGNSVQYQTVDNSPANTAAISLASPANTTYRKNIAFVPGAVTMVTADLETPPNVVTARHELDGVSMQMTTQYIIGTGIIGTRLDVLWGSLWQRPEWACVVADSI